MATVYRASTRCYCPSCGAHVRLDRSPRPPEGPPGVVMPEVMFSGLCGCGAGITLAASVVSIERREP